jgi:RimJ/RimL family protein N-acetyltransferase
MAWLEPTTLRGTYATLVPLSHEHHDGLVEALGDGQLWKLWYTTIPSPDQLPEEIERRLAMQRDGSCLPFTVISAATGTVVGRTNYLNVDAVNRRLEIGGTWYRSSLQRTAINTQCKLLLLSHAFETLDCIAVEFRTHFCNHQSRRGIERLGAKLDGILRSHQAGPNGLLRDTCVYSVIACEWPTVRQHLTWRIAKRRNA